MFDEAGGEPYPVSGRRCSACGRKDGGGGLLESPESLQPQLGWFKGERGALSFSPGAGGEVRVFCSSGPAEPSSVPLQ